MKVSGTPTDGEILDDMVFTETMRDDRGIFLVLTNLNLLFVKVDVETSVCLLKLGNVKVLCEQSDQRPSGLSVHQGVSP